MTNSHDSHLKIVQEMIPTPAGAHLRVQNTEVLVIKVTPDSGRGGEKKSIHLVKRGKHYNAAVSLFQDEQGDSGAATAGDPLFDYIMDVSVTTSPSVVTEEDDVISISSTSTEEDGWTLVKPNHSRHNSRAPHKFQKRLHTSLARASHSSPTNSPAKKKICITQRAAGSKAKVNLMKKTTASAG